MSAAREAFQMVPETCPEVDAAAHDFKVAIQRALQDHLPDFVEAVKHQTGTLRDALVQAIAEKHDAQAKARELEDQVADLESQVVRLEGKVSSLERELDDARADVQSMELPC